VVQQNRVFLLAEKPKDALDKRLFPAIVRGRVRRGKTSWKNGIVDGEGYEEQERNQPDTRNKEAHNLQDIVTAGQVLRDSKKFMGQLSHNLLAVRFFGIKPIVPHQVLDDKRYHGTNKKK
jgi:hypothetical protein